MFLNSTRKYFIRYFIAFIIPIFCLSILFFYNNITYTNEDSANYNLALLKQFASDFDSLLLKTQNTALHMSTNELILSFDNQTSVSYKPLSSEMLKLLRSYESNLSEDITVALYPRGGNTIYLKDEIITYADFEKSQEYELELSISGFYIKLNNIPSEYSLEIRNPNDKQNMYATILMYPIPIISASPKSTVCFMIKKDKLNKMSEKYFGNAPIKVYVFNPNFQNVNASDTSQIPNVMAAIKNNHLGISEYKDGKSTQVLMRTISENTKYQYIISMSKDEFYSAGQTRMNFLIILIVILLIFSAIMAIWLAMNYYNSILSAETKNQEITTELNNQHIIVVELVLRRLLNGSIRNFKKIEYNLNCANIVFDKKYYAVITFFFHDCFMNDAQFTSLNAHINSMNNNMTTFYFVKIEEENQAAAIINFEDNEESKIDMVEWLYNYISDYNLEYFEIGCGGTYKSPINISNSYVESVVAVGEKINKQKGNCYIFKIEPKTEEGFYYPQIEEAVIQQSIKNGNPDIAITSLREIFINTHQSAVSEQILKCLCYNIINMAAKIASSTGFPLKAREVSELSSYESLEMLQQKIEEIIRSLAEKILRDNEHRTSSTKLKVIEYVQKNFNNSALSLDYLSNEFNLSYSHISKIFKDETGQNFLSYLTQLRFIYIKRRLSETDTPIKDIITEAGYFDVANFMRKFKKSEGMTLGQYRQSKRDNS